MIEYVEVTQGAGYCHIEPLLKGIGGQVCKKKHKSTLNSVISVKGLLQISISQEEYSIPCLVHGHMLSGAWTMWGHFLGLWEIEDGSWLELITSRSR